MRTPRSNHDDEAHLVDVEQLLTCEEVASILQVEPSWVYAAVRRGQLPHVRVGRYVRFTRTQITSWIDGGGS